MQTSADRRNEVGGVEIPLYQYRVKTQGPDTFVLTFRDGGNERVGTILAPAGSELRIPPKGPPQLKVPKPGRPFEYDVFAAAVAYQEAKSGRFGLKLAKLAAGVARG